MPSRLWRTERARWRPRSPCADPPNEIELVRRIFNMFVAEGQSMAGISVRLNKEGVPSTYGYVWTTGRVASLLKSELMIATMSTTERRTV
ncbi:recombinase family protein [Mesorhizobium sp. M1217]|uniref:recombinase family protein n=1 Tax=Mesorhizobium sp. M1217 TaxID=2957070 RepID=UPI00333E13E1